MTVPTQPGNCPTCFVKLDMATGETPDAVPQDGDASVCMNCGEILVFRSNRPVLAQPEDIYRWRQDPGFDKLKFLQLIVKSRGRIVK